MKSSLIEYVAAQPLMRVIKSLLETTQPRHIRDLASQHALSPAGVSDIVRRLKAAGALKERRIGNRRCVSLNICSEEMECMRLFFTVLENTLLEKRAKTFSRTAAKKLEWMEEASEFYRDLKRGARDPS